MGGVVSPPTKHLHSVDTILVLGHGTECSHHNNANKNRQS